MKCLPAVVPIRTRRRRVFVAEEAGRDEEIKQNYIAK